LCHTVRTPRSAPRFAKGGCHENQSNHYLAREWQGLCPWQPCGSGGRRSATACIAWLCRKWGTGNDFQSTCTAEGKASNAKAAPTLEDIVDAIAALDPAKDFGKNGKPNVEALEDLLDANITAALRDEAWDVFQKEQAEENGGEG
jgi:hypothetical protein